MYKVINKYTGRLVYQGEDKQAAKAAYKRDPGGLWVYKQVEGPSLYGPAERWVSVDLRTFEPKTK